MEISKDLKDAMVALRLSGILPTLAERISYAASKKLSYEEFLEVILFDEWERRQARLLNSKMRKAGVEACLESYSWDTTTAYDRQIVRKLFSLAFVENHYSVLIFGPAGVGKTFLAKHIAFCALKGGYSVTFTRADKFFKHLRLSTIDGTYERTIGSYIRPDILVIDDYAVKEMTREEAGQFYEIILERHNKKSNIITSARSPEEWQALFPDPILGNSSLDRLAHSSYQILMEGESIRKQSRPN
jgi:DNA replication protein DnaC